jgi:hypothetical protein
MGEEPYFCEVLQPDFHATPDTITIGSMAKGDAGMDRSQFLARLEAGHSGGDVYDSGDESATSCHREGDETLSRQRGSPRH